MKLILSLKVAVYNSQVKGSAIQNTW